MLPHGARGLLSLLLHRLGPLVDSGLEAGAPVVVPGILVPPGSTPPELLLGQPAALQDVQCPAHPLQGHCGRGVGHEAGELGIKLEWDDPSLECT